MQEGSKALDAISSPVHPEALRAVFRALPSGDVCRAAAVCRAWCAGAPVDAILRHPHTLRQRNSEHLRHARVLRELPNGGAHSGAKAAFCIRSPECSHKRSEAEGGCRRPDRQRLDVPSHPIHRRRAAAEHPSAWASVRLRECPHGGRALHALHAAGRLQHTEALDLARWGTSAVQRAGAGRPGASSCAAAAFKKRQICLTPSPFRAPLGAGVCPGRCG